MQTPNDTPRDLDATGWRDQLLTALGEQRTLLEQLQPLAAEQRVHVDSKSTAPLLNVLGRRQVLVDGIVAMQGRLAHLTDGIDVKLAALAVADQETIRDAVRGIDTLLESVLERDRVDQASLQAARDELRGELQTIGTGQAAHQAYKQAYTRSPSTPAARFADRQG